MRTILLKAFASILTVLAAGVGLFMDPSTSARSDAAPPAAVTPLLHPDLPSYPGVYETAIGKGLHINGQVVDMHQFFTSDPPEKVSEYYEGIFRSLTTAMVSTYEIGNAHYVGFVTDEGRFLQVMILEDEGGSLVIPNLADGPMRPGHEASALRVPLPDDAANLSTFRSDDGGKLAVVAQFITSMDMEALARFYREKLPPLGYRQAKGALLPTSMAKNGLLRFLASGGEVVSIGVQGLEGDYGSLVYILQQKPISP